MADIQYFAVIYCPNGSIHLEPGETQEACLEKLRRVKGVKADLMKATTVIKRDMSNFKDGMIFGNPKSLDVMQEKEKRRKRV